MTKFSNDLEFDFFFEIQNFCFFVEFSNNQAQKSLESYKQVKSKSPTLNVFLSFKIENRLKYENKHNEWESGHLFNELSSSK